jgi:hypothetical protein
MAVVDMYSCIILTDPTGEYASDDGRFNWDDWGRVEIQPDGTLDRRSARITISNRTTQLLTDLDGEAADDVNWDDWDRVAISSQGTVDAASYDRSQTRRNRAANPDNSIIITDQKGEF